MQQFESDEQIFNRLSETKPDRIIFDKLDVSPELALKIKAELGTKLIIFTNLTEANQHADMTVLADIGSNFKNIAKRETSGRIEYYGPKYWLLRPEFYEFKKLKKAHKSKIENLMLMFGGADPANMSSQVLDEILGMAEEFNVLLVLGGSFKHHSELNGVLEKNKLTKCRLRIAENLKEVAKEMYSSDVVFASPGLSFFEALAVGTPVVGFHQDELQRDVYADILPTHGREDVFKVPTILRDRTFLFPEDLLISQMEIGEGKDELIEEILR
ncbi:hypothetical protein [Bdellovibrio bacteriovorus]|uniref:hypothetical protein n=1 Tax=Bdellovibrio bacteriovorus TaxID=959 RepID=UPI0035A68DFD